MKFTIFDLDRLQGLLRMARIFILMIVKQFERHTKIERKQKMSKIEKLRGFVFSSLPHFGLLGAEKII